MLPHAAERSPLLPSQPILSFCRTIAYHERQIQRSRRGPAPETNRPLWPSSLCRPIDPYSGLLPRCISGSNDVRPRMLARDNACIDRLPAAVAPMRYSSHGYLP